MADRHVIDFKERFYPAFSRRATQVCILSGALERIEGGEADAPSIAREALQAADPFGWKLRRAPGVQEGGSDAT